MSTLSNYMASDHRECDDAFARAENASAAGDWSGTGAAFANFHARMARHLAMEEEILFPAFEDATGMSGAGPTEVMRTEHAQMRGLLEQMTGALAASDRGRYLGLCETLRTLVQQHSLKEERVLYSMMDQVLGAQAGELIGRCNALEPV